MNNPFVVILDSETERAEAMIQAHIHAGKRLSARASALYSRIFDLSEDAACGMPVLQEDAALAVNLADELAEVLSSRVENMAPEQAALVKFQQAIPGNNVGKLLIPMMAMPFVGYQLGQMSTGDAFDFLAQVVGFIALVAFAAISAGVILEGGNSALRKTMAVSALLVPVLAILVSLTRPEVMGPVLCAGFIPVAFLGFFGNSEGSGANDAHGTDPEHNYDFVKTDLMNSNDINDMDKTEPFNVFRTDWID